MTLMYTFSRRAGLVRRIMRVEGLRSALLARSCPLRGTAASPVLPPSWRRYQPGAAPLHGAAANPALPSCMVRPGAGGPSTGM